MTLNLGRARAIWQSQPHVCVDFYDVKAATAFERVFLLGIIGLRAVNR
jgi:hypothetical protein